jgi:hypothetical protein
MRRVNVFADSHYSDIRKRHGDLHCRGEALETRIDLSSTGLKTPPASSGRQVRG